LIFYNHPEQKKKNKGSKLAVGYLEMSWFLERRAFFAVHETFCWVDFEEMICESLTIF
jgi:hypothetical protein